MTEKGGIRIASRLPSSLVVIDELLSAQL